MLNISVETVAWIILKAREFDTKQAGDIATTEDDGDNPLGVLEDREDDATVEELVTWITDLTQTQQAELVALMWLGRGDDDASDFASLVEEARGQQGARTAPYLLGTPRLGDYLEDGLEKLGVSTAEVESALS